MNRISKRGDQVDSVLLADGRRSCTPEMSIAWNCVTIKDVVNET
jgi:hypothetical protein